MLNNYASFYFSLPSHDVVFNEYRSPFFFFFFLFSREPSFVLFNRGTTAGYTQKNIFPSLHLVQQGLVTIYNEKKKKKKVQFVGGCMNRGKGLPLPLLN